MQSADIRWFFDPGGLRFISRAIFYHPDDVKELLALICAILKEKAAGTEEPAKNALLQAPVSLSHTTSDPQNFFQYSQLSALLADFKKPRTGLHAIDRKKLVSLPHHRKKGNPIYSRAPGRMKSLCNPLQKKFFAARPICHRSSRKKCV